MVSVVPLFSAQH